MARPRQVSDADILATARALFLKHGPTLATSVIADALGISQPALFKRFHSKDELLIESMMCEVPDWEQLIGGAPDGRPLRRQLIEIAGRLSKHMKEDVPCAIVLRSSKLDLSDLHERFHDGPPPLSALRTLSRWLDNARSAGLTRKDFDAQAIATMLLGSVMFRTFLNHAAVTLPHEVGASDDPEHLGRIVDEIVQAIQPRPTSSPSVDDEPPG
ncbi:MAG: TetR/AcrR family transcriptional regulator [Myxococcota bacterium]